MSEAFRAFGSRCILWIFLGIFGQVPSECWGRSNSQPNQWYFLVDFQLESGPVPALTVRCIILRYIVWLLLLLLLDFWTAIHESILFLNLGFVHKYHNAKIADSLYPCAMYGAMHIQWHMSGDFWSLAAVHLVHREADKCIAIIFPPTRFRRMDLRRNTEKNPIRHSRMEMS